VIVTLTKAQHMRVRPPLGTSIDPAFPTAFSPTLRTSQIFFGHLFLHPLQHALECAPDGHDHSLTWSSVLSVM
jgi:hypothetical protein